MDKIKQFLASDAQFYGLTLLLVGVTAFGLGRVSWPETTIPMTAQIIFSTSSVPIPVETAESSAEAISGQYVASKHGSKYHRPWCPGAQQMKEENKVWFTSVADATAAGYEPAANCPGLE